MTAHDHSRHGRSRFEVAISGTLRSADPDDTKPLAADDFHGIVERMADCLDDEQRIANPNLWGTARSGDLEIRFDILDPLAGPALNSRITDIISVVGDAAGVEWSSEPAGSAREGGVRPVLAQTGLRCDLVTAPS